MIGALLLGSLSAAMPAASPAPSALPQLNIDPLGITASGISSGADMVVQFSVAYSATIKGTGVFAGQPYHCAVTKFPEDTVVPGVNPGVPCTKADGCAPNTTLLYDHCKNHPQWVRAEMLGKYAREQAAAGTIDQLGNLSNHPVYLYRGTKDGCYQAGAEGAVIEFFRAVQPESAMSNGLIAFENTIPSLHAQPTIHEGSPCGGPYTGKYSYLASCGYDGAGAALQHVYNNSLVPPSKRANNSRLQLIDQEIYMEPGNDVGLAKQANMFVPPQCAGAGAKKCKLHIWFHGCGGCSGGNFYESSIKYAGFNEWAETNDIVILYPVMRSYGTSGQQHGCCWDGYGQTGQDYALQSGGQMKAVRKMLKAISGV